METTIHPNRARWQNHLITDFRLVGYSISLLAGIILGNLLRLPAWLWFFPALLCTIAVILISRHPNAFRLTYRGDKIMLPVLAVLILIFGGATRFTSTLPIINSGHIAYYNDRDYDLLVTGLISQPPDTRATYANLHLQVESIDLGSSQVEVEGKLLAAVSLDESYRYGQRVRLRGRLETPPESEDFSYRDYLARQDIHAFMFFPQVSLLPGMSASLIPDRLYALREKSLGNIYRLFPDPEASLLAGILLGVDTGLSRELQEAFKNTGTAHIIAISGFNITILAGVFFTLFSRWFGPRRGSLIAIGGIFFYAFLVGLSASVLRAVIMGALVLLAKQLGRRTLALNSLALTAAVMCFLKPAWLWDVGFQLSFFATLGLVLYAQPLSEFALRLLANLKIPASTSDRIIQPITDFILLTLAAQLTTLPIMAYHFQRISLVSLISNPFILPAQPAVMILGGLAVFTSLLIFPLGQIIAWTAWPFILYTIRVVEIFDRIPHGTLHLGNFSFWFTFFAYAALFGITLGWTGIRDWLTVRTERIRMVSLTGLLTLLFICGSLAWRSALSEGDGRLHITFFDVGSADAILVQTPDGRSVLINGGPSANRLSDPLGRRLSPFRRRLDWLIIAGTRENETDALPRTLERFPAAQVLWSGNVQASFSARQLDLWLADHAIPVAQAEVGQKLNLGDEAFIEVAAVGERGSTLLVEWKDFRLVLPIGIDAETMAELGQGDSLSPADVLLLADAGYSPSNTSTWIANLNPGLTILSVAAGDPDGLPDAETLESLAGRSLLRTDRNGWISISTDGEGMRVLVERETAREIEVTLEPHQPTLNHQDNGFHKIIGDAQ